MGGYGSGRSGGRYPVEGCRRLDMRELVRGAGGDVVARDRWKLEVKRGDWTVTIERQGDELTLTHRAGWEADEKISYRAGLAFTRPHYGGLRPWFRCPAVRCGRRCAVLYLPNGGRWYLCRRCYRLAYESTRLQRWERLRRRADRILERAGIEDQGNWLARPPGMHWRRFVRVCDEAERYRRAENAEFNLTAARLVARFGLGR